MSEEKSKFGYLITLLFISCVFTTIEKVNSVHDNHASERVNDQRRSIEDGMTCPSGYIFNEDSKSCFKFFSNTTTFQNARQSCFLDGGDLAKIDSPALSSFVGGLCTDHCLIGLNDRDVEGDWRWSVDNSQIDYDNWSSGEPNGAAVENCVVIHKTSKVWLDIQCTYEYAYLCEVQLPNPCPSGYLFNPSTKSCFKFYSNQLNFFDSRKECLDDGGDLAKPENEEIHLFISNLCLGSSCYIGLNDLFDEGVWRWTIDNSLWDPSFDHWFGTEPSGGTGEQCVANKNPEYKWVDVNCQDILTHVCEVRPRSTCPTGYAYDSISNSCYKKVTSLSTFGDARDYCALDGGDLAMPKTFESSRVLYTLFNPNTETNEIFWIGLDDLTAWQQGFYWVDGTFLNETGGDYTYWYSNQPDHGTPQAPQSCVITNWGTWTGWHDYGCGTPAFSFCEVPSLCPIGYDYYFESDSCLKYYTDGDKMAYPPARRVCLEDGGDLVKVIDENVQSAVSSLCGETCWIGLSDLHTMNEYRWVDNSIFINGTDYERWADGQPEWESTNFENCVGNKEGGLIGWHTYACVDSFSFVCEVKTKQICPKGYAFDKINKKCLKYYKDYSVTRPVAQSLCIADEADLVDIYNIDKEAALLNLFGSDTATYTDRAWAGLMDVGTNNWQWPDGTPYVSGTDYSNWGPSQPNSLFEDCIILDYELGAIYSLEWYDYPCTFSAPFFCQTDMIWPCKAGDYYDIDTHKCIQCSPGFYCPIGSLSPIASGRGYYCDQPGMTERTACWHQFACPSVSNTFEINCQAGTFIDYKSVCKPCPQYYTSNSNSLSCPYPWCWNHFANDAKVCSNGRGTCDAINRCTCDSNYYGRTCQRHTCDTVDNLDTSVCNGFGTCTDYNTCVCQNGFSNTYCDICDDNVCNNGTCSVVSPGVTSCDCGGIPGVSGTNCDVCDVEGKTGVFTDGVCYVIFKDVFKKKWQESRDVCKAWHQASDLAVIKDINAQNAIMKLKGKKYMSWILMTDWVVANTWEWMDGSTHTYRNWNEPKYPDEQGDCAYIHKKGKWLNHHCNSKSMTSVVCAVELSDFSKLSGGSSNPLLNVGYQKSKPSLDYCNFETDSCPIGYDICPDGLDSQDVNSCSGIASGECKFDTVKKRPYCECQSGKEGSYCEEDDVLIAGRDCVPLDGICYYIFNDKKFMWEDSRRYCKTAWHAASDLAKIKSPEIQELVSGIVGENTAWIGALDFSEGNFKWVDGDVLSYTNWIGTPDDGKTFGEDCVAMEGSWKPFNSRWSTVNCSQRKNFVCQVVLSDVSGSATSSSYAMENVRYWNLNTNSAYCNCDVDGGNNLCTGVDSVENGCTII